MKGWEEGPRKVRCRVGSAICARLAVWQPGIEEV